MDAFQVIVSHRLQNINSLRSITSSRDYLHVAYACQTIKVSPQLWQYTNGTKWTRLAHWEPLFVCFEWLIFCFFFFFADRYNRDFRTACIHFPLLTDSWLCCCSCVHNSCQLKNIRKSSSVPRLISPAERVKVKLHEDDALRCCENSQSLHHCKQLFDKQVRLSNSSLLDSLCIQMQIQQSEDLPLKGKYNLQLSETQFNLHVNRHCFQSFVESSVPSVFIGRPSVSAILLR